MRPRKPPLLVAWALGCSVSAAAGIPDTFTNLQVLPKTSSRDEIVATMRGWASALGVRCGHCHGGGNPDTLEGVDFASDAKWEKRTARAMVRMVGAINTDYLGGLDPRPGAVTPAEVLVACVTCHRGVPRPESIESVLARRLKEGGATAALDTYKDLRARYLASGSYDFSQGPLNMLGETLIGDGRWRDALVFLEYDAEQHPDAPWPFFLLGKAWLAGGDRARALEAFERSLALGPENPLTRESVETLRREMRERAR